MTRVILHPTWKLIPEGVSWPIESDYKIVGGLGKVRLGQTHEEYYEALEVVSRHLVDIAEEDWMMVHLKVMEAEREKPSGDWHGSKSDTVYSIDAEFEVKDQYRLGEGWSWGDLLPSDAVKFNSNTQYRQIARLVKAKEEWQPKDPGPAGHFKPTESQDELWDEIVRDCTDPDGFLDIDLARKSFRIERI